MNENLSELLIAIVSYVTEHDGYVTKTKLLKLVYLFDVEFYRLHGRTFTGFQWKYFHLGPWTREFDPLLEELVSRDLIVEKTAQRSDYDTKYLHSHSPANLRKPFDNYSDEVTLKSVLETWGSSTTGEILDYVYFHTEPMEQGIRNEPLDFTRVLRQAPVTYKRDASVQTLGEISKLRRDIGQRVSSQVKSTAFSFTEPHYDEEFYAAMEKLDGSDL